MESYKMLIDGQWVDSETGETFEVINPATEEPFASVPRATKGQVQQALEAADSAFPQWSALSPEQRGAFLWKASHILASRKEMIGALMTREQGKPLKEAVGEIEKAVEMLQYFAEEGKRAYGTIIANADPMDQSLVVKQPVGVVAALSAWNYPVELTGWKAAASLAAGCTIVAKPPTLTPLSPLEFWRCLFDAGIPDGVINAVTGSGESVGRELVTNPISKKVAFTGSLEVGLKIQEQCKDSIKKISLELGGHCPLIVSKNCNLEKAVKGAVRRSFRNMGQICIAINRIYVHKEIHDRFLDAFSRETQKLTMGDGLKNPESDLGAMASLDGLKKSMHHVEDAVSKGAAVVTGGKKPEGLFFLPYLIGERCPHADPHARGGFLGLTLRHDRRDILRSVFESVIYSLRDVVELIRKMGYDLTQVRTSGGGALSPLWRQIHADVFNSEVITVSGSSEGGAYGAALVAGAGVGLWKDVEEAVGVLEAETKEVPIAENVALYDRLFPIYRDFYGALKGSFDRISEIYS